MILMASAGAVAVNEKYSDAASSTQNAEAVAMGQMSAFRRTFPKLDFLITPMVFASLTDWGRVRVEITTSFSYEVFSDFYIGLEGFYTFDSRPPTETVSKKDYGISTTISWKFNK
jgi:hypothetical protein